MIPRNIPAKAALLADIHGNSPALQAVLKDIRHHACSRVFVLGDIINGVDPHGCIELLRKWSDTLDIDLACLKGNAEFYLLTPDLDALPRKNEPWNANLVQLIRWFQAHLSETDLEWIRSFSDFIRWNDAGLAHDSPVDRLSPQSWHIPGIELKYQEWFYHSPGIQPDMAEHQWQKLLGCMEEWNLQQVFCGHTHIPFCREFGRKRICNVGSVGAPLDGDPRAAWVMVEEWPAKEQTIEQTITIRRVDYDIARIHQLIDQTPDYTDFRTPGTQEAYKKWLSSGVHWRAHLSL